MTSRFRFHSSLAAALLLAASLGLAGAVRGAEPFEAFLQKHCVRCHGPEKEKGDLRVDQLSRDFKLGVDSHHWAEAIENVNSGEDASEEGEKPTQEEIRGISRVSTTSCHLTAIVPLSPHTPSHPVSDARPGPRQPGTHESNFLAVISRKE